MRSAFVCAAVALPVFASAAAFASVVTVPDNGFGTAAFPPVNGFYEICPEYPDMHVIDGLIGGQLNITCQLGNFVSVIDTPGGPLGGWQQTWTAVLGLNITGTGAYSSYFTAFPLVVTGSTATAPYALGPVQIFATQLSTLQGSMFTHPHFDLFRVTIGTGYGLPSPGSTTLTDIGGGQWNVDSFFDITYRIDFIGSPGGPFGGLSGSTTGQTRICLGEFLPSPGAAGVLAMAGLAATRRRRA